MKRICSLCKRDQDYRYCAKYKHGLQLCSDCALVLIDLVDVHISSTESFLRR